MTCAWTAPFVLRQRKRESLASGRVNVNLGAVSQISVLTRRHVRVKFRADPAPSTLTASHCTVAAQMALARPRTTVRAVSAQPASQIRHVAA